MIAIACVEVGNYCGRGAEYVRRLRDSVAEHLTVAHRFVCISDRVIDGVECLRAEPGLPGWWQKLALFKPGKIQGERIVFLDLDTVIVGDLAPLVEYAGDFGMVRDFYHLHRTGSAVMGWRNGAGNPIWDAYVNLGCTPEHSFGDGGWIADRMTADRLQDYVTGIVSWKADCGGSRNSPHGTIPDDARVVCFHGRPRPHETEIW